jgi:hypothetical protein
MKTFSFRSRIVSFNENKACVYAATCDVTNSTLCHKNIGTEHVPRNLLLCRRMGNYSYVSHNRFLSYHSQWITHLVLLHVEVLSQM